MALGTSVAQAGCDTQDFEGTPITACAIDPATDDLRLFLYDAEGAPFGSFDALNDALGAEQLQLDIAMNGGMFHTDRAPVGHYVEEGTEVVRGSSLPRGRATSDCCPMGFSVCRTGRPRSPKAGPMPPILRRAGLRPNPGLC